MDYGLAWLIAGFGLIIAELLTGTFYLLVLGVACFAGGGVSYAGGTLGVQSGVAALCALIGLAWVHRYRTRLTPERMRGLDIGQPASFDCWVDKNNGHARVRYRDTLWDAQIAGEASGESGEVLYVTCVNGNTLTVSKTRPA
jgi:membrane protein implicated in regulation of membrane protease activity